MEWHPMNKKGDNAKAGFKTNVKQTPNFNIATNLLDQQRRSSYFTFHIVYSFFAH
jgi:hypothetical protein